MSGTPGGRDPAATGGDESADHAFVLRGSEVTHEGMLTTLRVDAVHTPDGRTVRREIAQRPDAVAMVPLTADGEVILVRQYRHAVGHYELEIPAGLLDVDGGESAQAAAQRELAEEIGMTAGTLRRLLHFHNSAGWSDEDTVVYLATDLRPGPPPDGFEADAEEADMQVLRMPLADAVAAIGRDEIHDAKTVIGVLFVAAGAAP